MVNVCHTVRETIAAIVDSRCLSPIAVEQEPIHHPHYQREGEMEQKLRLEVQVGYSRDY